MKVRHLIPHVMKQKQTLNKRVTVSRKSLHVLFLSLRGHGVFKCKKEKEAEAQRQSESERALSQSAMLCGLLLLQSGRKYLCFLLPKKKN